MGLSIIDTWKNSSSMADAADSISSGPFPGPAVSAWMGWDGIVIRDSNVDPVDMLAAYLKCVASESCGQCTPCRLGTARLCRIMDGITNGQGNRTDLHEIRSLAVHISQTAKCDIGRTLAKPVTDLLDTCETDFMEVIENNRPVQGGTYTHMVTAPCMAACPSHVDIPAYLENVRMDQWDRAMAVVRNDCPMPGTIGRVCVRPCENHCRRGLLDAPLAIRSIKRFLADREMAGSIPMETARSEEKNTKVAIVGAGPAGLSCAYYLGQQGYACTIFEAQEDPGGMAAYGIPAYRLPRNVLAHEADVVKALGATIAYGVTVGKDIQIEDITAKGYGAVFIAVGAPESSRMRCEGEDAGYRCFMTGVDFLAQSARGKKPVDGKRLVVIGGGNVAMDCVRTARRLGFEEVTLLYRRTEAEMPADPQEIREAGEEGVRFFYLVAPVEILARDHAVCGLKCRRMELGEPDASGRRRPVPVAGSEFVIDCDVIIPAVGQVCVVDCLLPEEEAVTPWKTLVVDQTTFQSSTREIFGGGDCVTGPATLIGALSAGKNAARFIHQYLQTGACAPGIKDLLLAMAGADELYDPDETFAFPGTSIRQEPFALDPSSRINGFEEVEKGFSAPQARHEANRCLRCYRVLMAAVPK